jgi:hypothetical protein
MCLPAWPPGERLYTCFRNEAVAAPAGPRDGETPQPAVSKVKKGRQGLALSPPKGETCHAGTAPNTPTPEPRAPPEVEGRDAAHPGGPAGLLERAF